MVSITSLDGDNGNHPTYCCERQLYGYRDVNCGESRGSDGDLQREVRLSRNMSAAVTGIVITIAIVNGGGINYPCRDVTLQAGAYAGHGACEYLGYSIQPA
ncbi:MAG: hypothetical protein NNA20_12025 [Nitrospira sp.]|nr:hypothetical protein [Nitrospira sp.]MCP9443308.1 hypothetical protein [Nitrospira sp.]